MISCIFPFVIFCIIGICINFIEGNHAFVTNETWIKSIYLGQPTGIFSGSGWFLCALFWGELIFYVWKNKIENMVVPAQIGSVKDFSQNGLQALA